MWGWNEKGQLGLPSDGVQQSFDHPTIVEQENFCNKKNIVNLQLLPTVVDIHDESGELVDIVSAACGSRHPVLLSGGLNS